MKRFITFGSIEQFRTIIKNVQYSTSYLSFDTTTNTPIFDQKAKFPVVVATGSEKIHGTNASVCYSKPDGFWVQSRKNIIDAQNNPNFTGISDNADCAFAVYQRKNNWMNIITKLADYHNIDLNNHIISVFFEWCGGNIQKNSAVSGLDKRAIIFRYFKVSPIDKPEDINKEISKWVPTTFNLYWISDNEVDIYNIMNFPTVSIEIDFNNPLMSQNKMIEMVAEIEKQSLVGKTFGKDSNIGEGYVFTFEYNDTIYRFKVKGEEHSKNSGKVITLKPVDEALENKKIKFVNEIACISWRLEQMFNETKTEIKEDISMKHISIFLRKVITDVIKEESDVMTELKLEPKIINSLISKVAKIYFISKL